MKYIELNTFKKNNKVDFVDWNKPAIKTGGLWYKIKNIKIDNTNYPYVCVPDKINKPKKINFRKFNFSKEIKNKIKKINENKENLKQTSFLIDNNEYYITGIGSKSIRALKNDAKKEQYFWYQTKEGEKILEHLFNKIGQSILI